MESELDFPWTSEDIDLWKKGFKNQVVQNYVGSMRNRLRIVLLL